MYLSSSLGVDTTFIQDFDVNIEPLIILPEMIRRNSIRDGIHILRWVHELQNTLKVCASASGRNDLEDKSRVIVIFETFGSVGKTVTESLLASQRQRCPLATRIADFGS
jgi:hypothetical protein